MKSKSICRFLRRKSVVLVLGADYELSDAQLSRLEKLFERYGTPKKVEDWLTTIAYFVLLDLHAYDSRLRRLMKRAAAPDRLSMVLRYGKAEGLRRWADYTNAKTAHFQNRPAYWIGLGHDEHRAELLAKAVQRDRNERAVQKIAGSSEYTSRSCAYWLRLGFSEAEAIEKVRRVQARTKTKESIDRWQATLASKTPEETALIRMKKSHSIEGYLARGFSVDEAERRSREHYQKRRNASTISQKFCEMVSERIPDLMYKSNGGEKQICGLHVDLFHIPTRTVIEFYGDFWHCNPTKYSSEFNRHGTAACHVWLDDKRRLEKISSKVSAVGILWESEFRRDPDGCVRATIEFIEEQTKKGKDGNQN